MNAWRNGLWAGLLLGLPLGGHAYETLQGPTETRYWDEGRAWNGYTLFGARGTSYLIDMEGRVVNTWPVGTNPRFLDNGNLLDAASDDPSHGYGFVELDWAGRGQPSTRKCGRTCMTPADNGRRSSPICRQRPQRPTSLTPGPQTG